MKLLVPSSLSAISGAYGQYQNVSARRSDKEVWQPDRKSVGRESVDDPENRLRGGDGVSDNTQPTHGFEVTSASNGSPKLWSELTDIDDGCEIANEEDHFRARDLETTMTMSELITKLTLAAATTGMPLVPIPYTSRRALKRNPVP